MYGADLVPDRQSGPALDGDRLSRCIEALSERERTVVVLSFYDERSAAETAASMAISKANVRVIRRRAIRRPRDCMEAGA